MGKSQGKRRKPIKAAHSSDRERRIVVLYEEEKKVQLISTWRDVPGDVEVYAGTLAEYMDAKLIRR